MCKGEKVTVGKCMLTLQGLRCNHGKDKLGTWYCSAYVSMEVGFVGTWSVIV